MRPNDKEWKLDSQGFGRIGWARDVGSAHIGSHDFLSASMCKGHGWGKEIRRDYGVEG